MTRCRDQRLRPETPSASSLSPPHFCRQPCGARGPKDGRGRGRTVGSLPSAAAALCSLVDVAACITTRFLVSRPSPTAGPGQPVSCRIRSPFALLNPVHDCPVGCGWRRAASTALLTDDTAPITRPPPTNPRHGPPKRSLLSVSPFAFARRLRIYATLAMTGGRPHNASSFGSPTLASYSRGEERREMDRRGRWHDGASMRRTSSQ